MSRPNIALQPLESRHEDNPQIYMTDRTVDVHAKQIQQLATKHHLLQ